MCGIIVDMTIINILIRECFQQLIPVLDNKNENYGDYVGNNFINVNLINLFTNVFESSNSFFRIDSFSTEVSNMSHEFEISVN